MADILNNLDEHEEGVEYRNILGRLTTGLGTAQTQINRMIEIQSGWDGNDVTQVDADRTTLKNQLLSLADLADPLTP